MIIQIDIWNNPTKIYVNEFDSGIDGIVVIDGDYGLNKYVISQIFYEDKIVSYKDSLGNDWNIRDYDIDNPFTKYEFHEDFVWDYHFFGSIWMTKGKDGTQKIVNTITFDVSTTFTYVGEFTIGNTMLTDAYHFNYDLDWRETTNESTVSTDCISIINPNYTWTFEHDVNFGEVKINSPPVTTVNIT